MAETLIQLLLAGLLAMTVVWCTLVHRRLVRLRTEQDEMQAFIDALTRASERAEAAIVGLRSAGETIASELVAREEDARRMARELGRLTDAARVVARPLAVGRAGADLGLPGSAATRGESRTGPEPVAAAKPLRTEPQQADTSAERRTRLAADLLRALQAMR
jgi:hypothetical protein